MKILIVASYNKQRFAPFIVEQAEALQEIGVEVDFFGVVGKGILGYLKNWQKLRQKITDFQPDIIHAHYGLCGLLANLQRKIPVVTTYHGSDINEPKVLCFSRVAMRLSAWNIFVSQRNVLTAKLHNKFTLLPCGVDLQNFTERTKSEARHDLGWSLEAKKVLFAGAFDNKVKNPELAKAAVNLLPDVELVELKGFSRSQIADLFYATDAFLMTSHTEGSPQVVKEAMACGCPVVSVDVGDVAERISDVENCFLADRNPQDLAEKLQQVIRKNERTNGREKLLEMGLDNAQIAQKLLDRKSVV